MLIWSLIGSSSPASVSGYRGSRSYRSRSQTYSSTSRSGPDSGSVRTDPAGLAGKETQPARSWSGLFPTVH